MLSPLQLEESPVPVTITKASTSASATKRRFQLLPGEVMKASRRGTADWSSILRPFVSSLVFRCVHKRRAQSDPSFFPWSGHCALLFVDLSEYSKVTSALADKGAFVLSSVVNAYLERLLMIVREYGGDVVKFAGDAILIVWEGEKEELDLSVLCAAQCAIQMQERAGTHEIEGYDLKFRIHIGLCCGRLETEIFEAPTHVNMQRLYHAIGGKPLEEIGGLVDLAKSGEVCVSEECHRILKLFGSFRRCGPYISAHILTSLNIDDTNEERIENHVDNLLRDRELARKFDILEAFVPPCVINLLVHSGNSPTQIAQMRNLCVLFIGMTSTGSPVNWLLEVHGILDKHRCPIVQIIHDDKGVHVVAAVNLYESVPEATTLALDAARVLVQQQVGCSMGMAMGSTFCGVTGCAQVACRWDITGFPVVRAARLMQWATLKGIAVAIDETIYNNTVASNRMVRVSAGINLKGTANQIPVFTLSESSNFAASMIMEHTTLAPIHNDIVDQIYGILSGSKCRGVVVITGPPLAGKKSICQRAAGRAGLVPIRHICSSGGGHFQLARTIVTWYRHCRDPEIREVAAVVENHLNNQHWSRAHEECVRLFNVVMVAGYHGCFIVDRCQFLDDFSISLIRDCVGGSIQTKASQVRNFESLRSSIAEGSIEGKIFFLCVHFPLYKWPTDHCFVYGLQRTKDIDVSLFRVTEVPICELRIAVTHCFDLEATQNYISVIAEQAGFSVGCFLKRIEAIRTLSVQQSRMGKSSYSMINSNLNLFIPSDMVRHHRKLNIMQVSPEIGMRFTQGFDELPPRYQTFMKLLGILPTKGFVYLCPFHIISEVMDDIFDEGVETDWLETVLIELRDLYMIKVHGEGIERRLSLYNPALADVVFDVSTPAQVQYMSTAILGRLEPHLTECYEVPMVCATLWGHLKDYEQQKGMWIQGYTQLLKESSEWTEERLNALKFLLQQEMLNSLCCPELLLGGDFSFTVIDDHTPISHKILMLKNYSAPISYGPLGHTFNVITRCTFREIRVINGGATEDENEKIRYESASAFSRFKQEVGIVENFLREKGYGESNEYLQKELELVEKCTTPGKSRVCVEMKAHIILDELLPHFVAPRLKRLHLVCARLRGVSEELDIMKFAPHPIRMAYSSLRLHDDRNDSVQHALITLATQNWVPRKLPEDLPPFHYQTTARIRDAVLRTLSQGELELFQYQHSWEDLEAFLVTTAILTLFCERVHKGEWY